MDRPGSAYGMSLDWLERAGTVLCVASVATLIAVTGWQVFSRYVLNSPSMWGESLSMLLVLIVSFVGGALCVRSGTHMKLGVFVAMLPPALRRCVSILAEWLMLAFGLAMLVAGFQATRQVWGIGDPTLPISRGGYYLPITIAGAMIVCFQVERIRFAYRQPPPDR